jgi:hypothetical protein
MPQDIENKLVKYEIWDEIQIQKKPTYVIFVFNDLRVDTMVKIFALRNLGAKYSKHLT